MNFIVIAANVLGWPLIHLILARVFLSIPDTYFAQDSWLTRERRFEQTGRIYRRAFFVHKWKGLLPDGAPWLGGRAKKRIATRSVQPLKVYLIETRRAEAAHWCMLLFIPVFFVWNPAWACAVMALYGLSANLPCILVQRANRIKAAHILHANTSSRVAIPQL